MEKKKITILVLVAALTFVPLQARAEWCDIEDEACKFAYLGLIPGLPLVVATSAIDGRETGLIVSAAIGYSIFLVLIAPYAIAAKIFEKYSTSKNLTGVKSNPVSSENDNGQRGG